jgi:hypothetical protein
MSGSNRLKEGSNSCNTNFLYDNIADNQFFSGGGKG